jgi:hypothetical protein
MIVKRRRSPFANPLVSGRAFGSNNLSRSWPSDVTDKGQRVCHGASCRATFQTFALSSDIYVGSAETLAINGGELSCNPNCAAAKPLSLKAP